MCAWKAAVNRREDHTGLAVLRIGRERSGDPPVDGVLRGAGLLKALPLSLLRRFRIRFLPQ